jgi:pSer/pThr/pTyr-binding forkhead associated (FHA) protein
MRHSRIYIIDVGSTNGTFVNGLPLSRSSAYALHHNSVLTLGRLVFTLKILRVGTGDLDDDRVPASVPGSSPFVFTPSHPVMSTDDDPTLHLPARQAYTVPPDAT